MTWTSRSSVTVYISAYSWFSYTYDGTFLDHWSFQKRTETIPAVPVSILSNHINCLQHKMISTDRWLFLIPLFYHIPVSYTPTNNIKYKPKRISNFIKPLFRNQREFPWSFVQSHSWLHTVTKRDQWTAALSRYRSQFLDSQRRRHLILIPSHRWQMISLYMMLILYFADINSQWTASWPWKNTSCFTFPFE